MKNAQSPLNLDMCRLSLLSMSDVSVDDLRKKLE